MSTNFELFSSTDDYVEIDLSNFKHNGPEITNLNTNASEEMSLADAISGFAHYIIEHATEDTKFEPIRHNIRHRIITPIILVDNVDKYKHKDDSYYDPDLDRHIYNHSGLLFKKVGELDFWNDISGWFHTNTRCYNPHPVYDTTNGEIEIPSDVPVRTTWDGKIGSLTSPIVAGAYLVDKDYNLYLVRGWYNSDGSLDSYLDFA